MLVAGGQQDEASDLFRSVANLVLLSSAGLGIVIAVSSWFLPVREWFSLEGLSRNETRLVLLLLACQVVITLQSGVLEAGFRAGGRYPTGAACRQAVRVAEVLSVPAAAAAGLSPASAAFTFLVVTIVGTCASWTILRSAVGWLEFRPGLAGMARVRPLVRPALAYAALPLGNAVSIQGMVLVVGAVAGPVSVVTFQTARTLSRLPQGLMYAINQSVWPEVSAAFGAGRIALARSLHRRACQGSLVLTVLITAMLLPFGPLLIEGWTGGKVDVSYTLFASLLLVVGANSLWFTSSVVLVATNRHQRMAVLYLIGSILALGLAAVLVKPLGTRGAGFSLLAIDGMMAAYILPHSLKLVDDHFGAFARAHLHLPRRPNRKTAAVIEAQVSNESTVPAGTGRGDLDP